MSHYIFAVSQYSISSSFLNLINTLVLVTYIQVIFNKLLCIQNSKGCSFLVMAYHIIKSQCDLKLWFLTTGVVFVKATLAISISLFNFHWTINPVEHLQSFIDKNFLYLIYFIVIWVILSWALQKFTSRHLWNTQHKRIISLVRFVNSYCGISCME